jgi:hypothetical protein
MVDMEEEEDMDADTEEHLESTRVLIIKYDPSHNRH